MDQNNNFLIREVVSQVAKKKKQMQILFRADFKVGF